MCVLFLHLVCAARFHHNNISVTFRAQLAKCKSSDVSDKRRHGAFPAILLSIYRSLSQTPMFFFPLSLVFITPQFNVLPALG